MVAPSLTVELLEVPGFDSGVDLSGLPPGSAASTVIGFEVPVDGHRLTASLARLDETPISTWLLRDGSLVIRPDR